MSKKTLHIISLDIPYPPDRGSVIGIYNRIKAFHRAGIDVILHSFYKKFSLPNNLADYCKSIYLLPRKKNWHAVDLKWPLYIQSRRSEEMVLNLLKDDHPILFEGLHTLYHFADPRLENRHKSVRMHNIESKYYDHLANTHSNPIKKIYYAYEATKSDQIEKQLLPKANVVFSISAVEDSYLKTIHVNSKCVLPFINNTIDIRQGTGNYALYHGDLSINENEKAAIFLLDQVFDDIDYPLYIAGKNPSKRLINTVKNKSNIKLIVSPIINEMELLIREAHIILAPFSQTTGYKMKLLESMRMGRHILTSAIGQKYIEIKPVLHFASTAEEWKKSISTLAAIPMETSAVCSRQKIMHEYFDSQKNIQQMIDCIF